MFFPPGRAESLPNHENGQKRYFRAWHSAVPEPCRCHNGQPEVTSSARKPLDVRVLAQLRGLSAVGRGELGADLLGVGVAEAAEDVESLSPCVMRGIDVPVVVVDVAKVSERLRLAFGLADFPVQVARLLITGDGLVPVAEVAVDVGDAVHGVCGTHGVA